MKAMILAAGRGQRLNEYTKTLPKPLVAVKGKPLIVHHFERLLKAGINEVVINVHYKADILQNYLGDGSQYGIKLNYSFESELLNTGGGILQVLSYFSNEPFLLISGDVWSDLAFEKLFMPQDMLAHLLLIENPRSHPEGDFQLKDGLVFENDHKDYTYTGVSILHPDLFQGYSSGAFPLIEPLRRGIQDTKVSGELFAGQWFNVNTPEDLQAIK